MKISLSQRIYFFTISCCLLFIILVTSVLWSSQVIDIAFSREHYAQKIENHANILKQLITSENIYSSKFKGDEWLASHQKLTNQLNLFPELTPQQQTIQNSINSHNESVKLLFDKINKDKLNKASDSIKEHLKTRLITQLEIIRSDSAHLSSIVQNDIHNIIKHEVLFIVCIFSVSIFILLYGSFRLVRIFKVSLIEVKKAFENNHSGHFQKIKLSNQSNEFDNIVSEFNLMNKKLNETTVSLEVMKKTVEERTHVLEELSNTDPLTKVANRRALFERGNFELSRQKRTHNKLALILLDCDYFKKINDEFGHQIGDELLKHVCDVCMKEIREIDFLARYGGEEFIIILPDCNVNDSVEIAHRIQYTLDKKPYTAEGQEIKVTLSIGIGVLNDKHESFEQLIYDADQAMYLAKNNGRNRIEIIQ